MNDSKADDAGNDQKSGDDVIEQSRYDENENPCDERDDGLNVADAEGHDFVLDGGGVIVIAGAKKKTAIAA